jgi:RNA polymerase sigma-70 factor (ECF subfamily)
VPLTDRHSEIENGIEGSESFDERAMVACIRAGDGKAFDTMVVMYYEPMLRLAVSYLYLRESAEEVVQDVLLAIWQKRAQWQPTGALRLYLFTATRNRAFSQLRHRRVEQRLAQAVASDGDVLAFTPKREAADHVQRTTELDQAIHAAIDALPPRMKETFVLSRHHHMSHEEIARVMGTSIKTVQEQIGRALKVLRGALADWLE